MFVNIFRTLPEGYVEAAKLDGAGNWKIFIEIITPLTKNILFTILVLNFIGYWNAYTTALLYLPSYPTIALAVWKMSTTNINSLATTPMRMCGAMILFVPTFLIVRHWIKTQACTNDRIICYATNNCESIIRSATHYGVNAIVDGEDNITAVANGESYNIPAYNGDKMFFGWVNGGAIMTNTTVTEETTVEALVLGATNTAGVSLRWLHAGEASLKWTVTFDKSDYDALVAFFGEEKVALGYEITTTSDTSKKITKTGDAIDTVVNGDEISFSVLLSHITEDHYDWAFNTRTFVVVDGAEYSVEDNNNTTSLKALAQAEYDLVSDVETAEFKYEIIEGDDEGKFSKYSTAQRRVLEGYIA